MEDFDEFMEKVNLVSDSINKIQSDELDQKQY